MSKGAVLAPDFTRAETEIKQVLTLLSVARLEQSTLKRQLEEMDFSASS